MCIAEGIHRSFVVVILSKQASRTHKNIMICLCLENINVQNYALLKIGQFHVEKDFQVSTFYH